MGEHPGLARAGAGDDQQRPVAVDHGLPLRGVQALQELCMRRHPLTLPTGYDGPRHPFWRPIRSSWRPDQASERNGTQRPHRAQPLASPTVADGRIARLRTRVTEAAEWAASDGLAAGRHRSGGLRTGPRTSVAGSSPAPSPSASSSGWPPSSSSWSPSSGSSMHAGGDAASALSEGGITAIAASQVSDAAADARQGRWLLLAGWSVRPVLDQPARWSGRCGPRATISARLPVHQAPCGEGRPGLQRGRCSCSSPTVGGVGRLRDATPGPGLILTIASVAIFVALSWQALRWLPGPDLGPRDLLPGRSSSPSACT